MRASRFVDQATPRIPDWAQLLTEAVAKPGIISTAYSRFWNYSAGNQLLALFQCFARGIPIGPIHTFRGWAELGRSVKKGEKAITLCMPVMVKLKPPQAQAKVGDPNKIADTSEPGAATTTEPVVEATPKITVFTYKPRWFVLVQTEGADYVPTELPAWSESRALTMLAIERIPFEHPNGNTQGIAQGRKVSVSPIAALPHKTLFHELAHVVLGHTDTSIHIDDQDTTPRNLREVEAECMALICCESLGLPGAPFCRGYIQHWLGREEPIPDQSAKRIFKAADSILKAGYPAPRGP